MMAYIDADKIKESIEALEYLIGGECTDTPMDFWDEIELAICVLKLYADVAEVKHGKWGKQVLVDDGFGGNHIGYICPVCSQFVPHKGNYCLNCGAKMDGGSE